MPFTSWITKATDTIRICRPNAFCFLTAITVTRTRFTVNVMHALPVFLHTGIAARLCVVCSNRAIFSGGFGFKFWIGVWVSWFSAFGANDLILIKNAPLHVCSNTFSRSPSFDAVYYNVQQASLSEQEIMERNDIFSPSASFCPAFILTAGVGLNPVSFWHQSFAVCISLGSFV